MWRSLAPLIFVTFVVSGAVAQSDRPSPALNAPQPPSTDQRGTNDLPLVIKVVPAPKTIEDSDKEEADRKDMSSANWWMVRLTGVIGFIGFIQLIAFALQARRLRQTVEIAKGQTADMRASIAQATRAAEAMERVAASMSASVEHAAVNVATSKQIAERQKLVTELQSRAYLSILFNGVVPQDSKAGLRFEPGVILLNNGNTPAYKVVFRSAADVLPHPIPNDFNFPLPDAIPSRSVSVIGPRMQKMLSAVVPKIYSETEAEQIKIGIGQRIHIWGVVGYEDAFGIERYVKFAQSVFWVGGVTPISQDTARHNDSN